MILCEVCFFGEGNEPESAVPDKEQAGLFGSRPLVLLYLLSTQKNNGLFYRI